MITIYRNTNKNSLEFLVKKREQLRDAISLSHCYSTETEEGLTISGIVVSFESESDLGSFQVGFGGYRWFTYQTSNDYVCVFPLVSNIAIKKFKDYTEAIGGFAITNGIFPLSKSFNPTFEYYGCAGGDININKGKNIEEFPLSFELDKKNSSIPAIKKNSLLALTFPLEVILNALKFLGAKKIGFRLCLNIISASSSIGGLQVIKSHFNNQITGGAFKDYSLNTKLTSGFILLAATEYGFPVPPAIRNLLNDQEDLEVMRFLAPAEEDLDDGLSTFKSLIYSGSVKFLKVVDGQMFCARIDCGSLFGKNSVKIKSYLNRKRLFFCEPVCIKIWGFYENEMRVRDWESDDLPIDIDRNTGIVKVPKVYPVLNESLKEENIRYIEEILNAIFPLEFLYILKKFMAQVLCSYRTLARPVLILTGLRGTGKTLFVDSILGSLVNITRYKNTEYDAIWKLDAGIIKVEESEDIKIDLRKLYNDIKDYCGSGITIANEKKGLMYKVASTGNFIVLSNERYPILIKDNPKEGNQFIHIRLERPLDGNPLWERIRYSVRDSKIATAMLYYTKYVLLPTYEQMSKKAKGYRYGFEIPVTSGVMELYTASQGTSVNTFVLDFLHEMWIIIKGLAEFGTPPYSFLPTKDIQILQRHQFITFRVKKILAPRVLNRHLMECTVIDSTISHKQFGKQEFKGFQIRSMDELHSILFPEEGGSIVKITDIRDSMALDEDLSHCHLGSRDIDSGFKGL